jgi:hypothetical protein
MDLWRGLKRKFFSIQPRKARALGDLDYALIWTDIRLFLSRFKTHQPFFCILDFRDTRVSVFPKVEELIVMLYGFGCVYYYSKPTFLSRALNLGSERTLSN